MNAVFCCLNAKYIHSSLAPWCLFAACRQKCDGCFDFRVEEGTVNEPLRAVARRIAAHTPDVVLFSCYIWNIEQTLQLCRALKKDNPQLTVVVGGPEVSYRAGQILEENEAVDFVSSGEGECSIPLLLTCLSQQKTPDIAGISCRNGKTLLLRTDTPETDFSISPICEEYLLSRNGRIVYTESSRGCPFSCAFCLSGRLGKVRFRELSRVKEDILLLSRCGTKTVKFVDRTFNCDRDRAVAILSFILENHGKSIPKDVCFHFEIAADLLNEKLFAVIEQLPVGCVQFEVGIQSFNENTLRAINRKTDLQRVESNVKRLLQKNNCHVHIDLIAGLPEEDYASFVAGFNRAYALKANMLQLGFLKILHGSPMAEHKELYPCTHCSTPPYEVQSTPCLSQDELQLLHLAENELERLYNSGRFRRTLEYVLSAGKLTPFALFLSFGKHLRRQGLQENCPLDAYTAAVLQYFGGLEGTDKAVLRDRMLCDRMATNNSGRIPDALKIADENLGTYKRLLLQKYPVDKGTNRCVAVLYSENSVVWCDYKEKHKVSGEYTLHFTAISDI